MKIQVLGTGCAKCKKLYAEVEMAVNAVGFPSQIEKIEEIDRILEFGVMMTPALVIDGEVVSTGRIPPAHEIAEFILKASAKEEA